MSSLSQFTGASQVWVSGATYGVGQVVLSPASNYQQYVRIAAGAGTTDPSSDTTNYRPFGGRAIKSIQRGVTSGNHTNTSISTITISSVDTSKSELRMSWASQSVNTAAAVTVGVRGVLTNSTTLTFTSTGGDANASSVVSWELTEWY